MDSRSFVVRQPRVELQSSPDIIVNLEGILSKKSLYWVRKRSNSSLGLELSG